MTAHVRNKQAVRAIYCIRCKENNKVYIGATIDLERRPNSHVSRLRAGWHENLALSSDWLRYGKESFEFIHFGWASSKHSAAVLENALVFYFDAINPAKGYNKRGGEVQW